VQLNKDFYWARVPMARGQAFDLAGWNDLPGGDLLEDFVSDLIAAPGASRLESIEPERGSYRFAAVLDHRLETCLFLSAKEPWCLPDRGAIAASLGDSLADSRIDAFLATPAAEAAFTGRTICNCFDIGIGTLRRAIVDDGLSSLAEIGAALRAGTNCGSCIPELNAFLREATPAA
jgi:assimilatory nitrate reductase catalytic subunit